MPDHSIMLNQALDKLGLAQYQISTEKALYETSNLIRILLTKYQQPEETILSIVLAFDEITTNALKYAGQANIHIQVLPNITLSISVIDLGKGIKDIDQAMRPHFSSNKNSLGLGLGIAKSHMDEFSIKSSHQGTCITMNKQLLKQPINIKII